MLEGEAEHWLGGAKSLLESGTEITCEVFLTTFNKYFLDSVKNEKEAKFIQLK